jgi:lysine decarboxylase
MVKTTAPMWRWATPSACSTETSTASSGPTCWEGQRRREPAELRSADQPTAPYLEAVVAYATRGSTRFHVPGHKGGAGADPGLRAALGWSALTADIPQDIEGIDLGHEPTPYQRAEQLAAEAHGAARTFFLTNGASQGNHSALPRAGAARRLRGRAAQLARVRDRRARALRRHADVRGARVRGRARDGARRHPRVAGRRLGAGGVGYTRAFIVSPTYYGMAPTWRAARGRHDAGVPLVVDQAWGPHFGFHPSAAAERAGARARTRC